MKWITKCTRITLPSTQPATQGQLYCVLSSAATSNKSQKKSEKMGKKILIFLCYVLSISNGLWVHEIQELWVALCLTDLDECLFPAFI